MSLSRANILTPKLLGSALFGCALLMAVAALRQPEAEALELMAFAIILTVLAAKDAECRTIPDSCIVSALAIRAGYLGFCALSGTATLGEVASSVAGALVLGGATLCLAPLIDRLAGTDSIGGGDIKLFAVVGAYFGVANGLDVVFLACLFGLASNWLVFRSEDGSFPFGPSIALACAVAIVVGA